MSLTTVVNGLSNPVDLQMPDDGTGRFFVVEQRGTIRIISGGGLLPGNFLDIQAQTTFNGEKGLLGLAFHPDYVHNHLFYVNYNPVGSNQTLIAEYQASSLDPNQSDPATERILISVNQPFDNHKGGQLAFGPDGLLYIGLGDGGSGGDPLNNGQNRQTLLGKMLRIDVDPPFDAGLQYAIPPTNPFVGMPPNRAEIWAYGFRNPWRFSFERAGTRLFCADVGQNDWEEIDLVGRGGNFGWRLMEGAHCFNPSSGCNMSGLTLPIAEYNHSEGVAVIGGHVYKGSAIAGLAGKYIFGDLNGKIWSLSEGPPDTWTRTQLLATGRSITSFGQDAAGEVYVVDYSGSILKMVPQ